MKEKREGWQEMIVLLVFHVYNICRRGNLNLAPLITYHLSTEAKQKIKSINSI